MSDKAADLVKSITNFVKDLAEETDAFKKTELFKQYLEVMSKFWNYSFHNQFLILIQKPNASRVMGFRKWNKLNRYVKRGEKGIKILCPSPYKVLEQDPKTKEEKEVKKLRFIVGNIFDVAQTDGEPLPDIEIRLQGDNYEAFFRILRLFCGSRQIKIKEELMPDRDLLGVSTKGTILLSKAETVNTKTAVLIHEIAHELIHKDRKDTTKQEREIQAEGVSYVVCRHFGMVSSGSKYLSIYNADHEKIMQSSKIISETSQVLIEYIEEKLAQ